MRSLTMLSLIAVLSSPLFPIHASAKQVYVNPLVGSDSANGLSMKINAEGAPVRSIGRAIAIAHPGDTVFLGGFLYRGRGDYILVTDSSSGLPGKPLVIDGQGAIIDASIPLDANECSQIAPGLYKNTALWPRFHEIFNASFAASPPDDSWLPRCALVYDGKLSRMGHSLKAPDLPYKKPSGLNAGEWTVDSNTHTYYFKIDPARKLDDYRIEVPDLVNGVEVAGTVSHVVFRNIIVKHVINDGFGLTIGNDPNSRVRDITYENIASIDCGDDGFSAHGDCDAKIDGFLVDGCGTGICSQGNIICSRLITRNIHASEIYFGSGRHVITDSELNCHGCLGAVIVMVWPNTYGFKDCSLKLENVAITADSQGSRIIKSDGPGACLDCNHVFCHGLSFQATPGASLKFANSLITGDANVSVTVQKGADWRPGNNLYNLGGIQIAGKSYEWADFAQYQANTGDNSRWISVSCGAARNGL